MHSTLTTLLDRLDRSSVSEAEVIPWGCPVLSFGNLAESRVATLGLNPSNREFVDGIGIELSGAARRFHTLASLGLTSWSEASAKHLEQILNNYAEYFDTNPYDTWFKRLDKVVAGAEASYYRATNRACHLDVVPFATGRKWSELTRIQRSALAEAASDTLAVLLRDSPVRVLILNGMSVVQHFKKIALVDLREEIMPDWSLRRRNRAPVPGIGYSGIVDSIGRVDLHRQLLVLGFNHNLQSSFGVTREVVGAIRDWIGSTIRASSY